MLARASMPSDPRFVLATWRARAVYQLLLDCQDAAGDYASPSGRPVAESLSVLAHCPRAEAEEIVGELSAAGLVEAHADRLCLLVCSARGRKGGKSSAERMRQWRRRQPRDGVTGSDASRDASLVTGDVTDEVPDNTSVAGKSDEKVTVAPVTSNGSVVPEVLPLPPHSPSSLSPTLLVQQGAPAREGLALSAPESKPKRSKPAAKPDVVPPEGTPAWRVWDAITRDAGLAAIVANPGDYALRVTDARRYPGVDVLAAVLDAAEFLARGTQVYTDGRQFLNNQLSRAAKRAAALAQPNTSRVNGAAPRGFVAGASGADFAAARGNAPVDTTKPIAWDFKANRRAQ